jgi:acyl-coenzyme A synthetase/AMP-(fatty) acid ligase
MGAQVVLLQPEGHLDIEVIIKTISGHQVTYMGTVPSQVNELIAFLHNTNKENLLKTLHRISSGGKTLSL